MIFDILVLYKNSGIVPMIMTEAYISQIKEAAPGEVYWCKDESEALANNIDAEVLFLWGGSGEMPVEYCLKSKKLQWINSFSAGVNPIMDSPISKLPVHLTNAKGIHGQTMALTTMGYIISFLRLFPEMFRKQQKHIWNKSFMGTPRDAKDKTVAIIGAGSIGSEVARMAGGLGMKVIGVKRNIQPLKYYDKVYSQEEIDMVLGMADFVVISTPLTEQTRHMIDREKLKCMKKTAVLINIARGAVVKESDLVTALQEGMIAGAALDATEIEPLPQDSPLWDMENVIITPHCSADSEQYMERAVKLFCENIKRFKNKKELLNEIDLSNKY